MLHLESISTLQLIKLENSVTIFQYCKVTNLRILLLLFSSIKVSFKMDPWLQLDV